MATTSTTLRLLVKKTYTKATTFRVDRNRQRKTTFVVNVMDTGGSFRGVMTEAQRDALAHIYPTDTVIATDDANKRAAQQYVGSGWIEGSEQHVPEGAIDHRSYFGGPVIFTGYTDMPDGFPTIQLGGTLAGETPTIAFNGPNAAGTAASPESIAMSDNGTTSTINLSSDRITMSGNVDMQGHQLTGGLYVSAAGRVNGADTDFAVTPANGTTYVVRNSTTGDVYHALRANGVWWSALAAAGTTPFTNRIVIGGTQRYEVRGLGELVVGTPTYTGTRIMGTPKSAPFSFTVPTDYFLDVINRLALTGGNRATLEGTADLILTDDFKTRSRIVLAGTGG